MKTRILFAVTFFPPKTRLLWENVEKYSRAGEARDIKMAHAEFTLGT
jgi:hypothetical protein